MDMTDEQKSVIREVNMLCAEIGEHQHTKLVAEINARIEASGDVLSVKLGHSDISDLQHGVPRSMQLLRSFFRGTNKYYIDLYSLNPDNPNWTYARRIVRKKKSEEVVETSTGSVGQLVNTSDLEAGLHEVKTKVVDRLNSLNSDQLNNLSILIDLLR